MNDGTDPQCCNGYDLAGFAGLLGLLALSPLCTWLHYVIVRRLGRLPSQRR